ncbi:MAG: tyrosine-type recombinase/integrase [Rhodospirillales bacterium]|nr:tyrosine-type recombinase/integrase [Rhodospirillales bacterium]
MPKITKRTVDALAPAEKERIVWDVDVKGFGVRVHPTGRKVYIVKYRHEGRSVKVTIGPHGPNTPAAARAKAAEIVTLAKTGRDVAGKMPRKGGGATVADLARRFMEEYAPGHLRPNTARLYRKIIDNRILPRLGKRRVGDVGKNDVAALHHEMRDVPGHANRTLSVLSRMLTLAEVWEMRPEGVNPCRHVKKYPEHRRERFLSDDEYGRLGAALRDAEREGFASPAAIAAIRLLMLTGCRSGEIMSLRWEYVDLDKGELRLRDSKTGSKVVHLGEPAIAVLRGIPRLEDSPWVLPGVKGGKHIAYLHDSWRRVLDRAGIENLRIHDLRHSFASGGLLVGEGLPVIGKLLGHNKVQTTARYAHLANDPLKAAANRIAGRIADAAG